MMVLSTMGMLFIVIFEKFKRAKPAIFTLNNNFCFSFDTENGISVKSKGYTKPAASPNDEPIQVIEGSYTFLDAYGKFQTIHYIADELGYRAYGDGIPQPHEDLLKSLAHRR